MFDLFFRKWFILNSPGQVWQEHMSGKSFAKDIRNGVNFQDMSVMRCICQGHFAGITSQEQMSKESSLKNICHWSQLIQTCVTRARAPKEMCTTSGSPQFLSMNTCVKNTWLAWSDSNCPAVYFGLLSATPNQLNLRTHLSCVYQFLIKCSSSQSQTWKWRHMTTTVGWLSHNSVAAQPGKFLRKHLSYSCPKLCSIYTRFFQEILLTCKLPSGPLVTSDSPGNCNLEGQSLESLESWEKHLRLVQICNGLEVGPANAPK